MTSVKQWIKTHRVELLLFLLLWPTYAYFYQSTQHNEAARFDQMRAIVSEHTLEINKFWWNTADVIHYPKNGSNHIYPNKAPGMGFLALAPLALFSFCLGGLRALGLPEWIYWHLVTYLTIIVAVGLLSSVSAVAIYRIVRRIALDNYLAVLVVLAIWLGTLAFPYSTLFFSHQFCAALLGIAFYLLFKISRGEVEGDRRRLIHAGCAGLLLGWSVISEYPTALPAGLMSIYAVWVIGRLRLPPAFKWKLIGTFAAGGAAAGIVLVLYSVAAFGKLFYIPYEMYARQGSSFAVYSHGWLGLHWPGLAQFFRALASITIYPQIGMLYLGVQGFLLYACSPVLWLVLPGLSLMIWQRSWRAEGLLIAAMIAAYVLFIASYGISIYDWSGASYLGTRHLIPLLPFLALPLYFGARKLRFIFLPLLAISVFYMLLATAIEPRVSYPYENPARDFLVPDYVRGKFAQSTATLFSEPRLITKDSTAFNLGKLAGLPGCFQLTPLLIWWLLAGGALLAAAKQEDLIEHRQSPPTDESAPESSPRIAPVFLLVFVAAINLPPIVHYAAASLRHPSRGLLGKYYRSANWTGEPVDVQVDPAINFDWSKTIPFPAPFSVEWTGDIMIDNPGEYTFSLIADDGALLEIDHQVVVDARVLLQERDGGIHLVRGLHPIRIRYFNTLFGGSIKFSWAETGRPKQIVPTEVLLPSTSKERQ